MFCFDFWLCSLYDNMWDDGNSLGPKEVHNYLTRVMYNRRNKFNPLWNALVLGGVKNGEKYLGMVWISVSLFVFSLQFQIWYTCILFSFQQLKSMYLIQVNMIGINFEDNHVATGLGNHLARPILRDEWHENLTFEDGVKLLEKCMRVLLYRDRSAVNKIQVLYCFLLCSLLYSTPSFLHFPFNKHVFWKSSEGFNLYNLKCTFLIWIIYRSSKRNWKVIVGVKEALN